MLRVQLAPLRQGTGYDETPPRGVLAGRWKTSSSRASVDPGQAPSETPAPSVDRSNLFQQ